MRQSTRGRSESEAGALGWKKGEKADAAGPRRGGKAQWGQTHPRETDRPTGHRPCGCPKDPCLSREQSVPVTLPSSGHSCPITIISWGSAQVSASRGSLHAALPSEGQSVLPLELWPVDLRILTSSPRPGSVLASRRGGTSKWASDTRVIGRLCPCIERVEATWPWSPVSEALPAGGPNSSSTSSGAPLPPKDPSLSSSKPRSM